MRSVLYKAEHEETGEKMLIELMESLIGSQSSNYNMGVQDCINLLRNSIPKKIKYVSGPTRDHNNPFPLTRND